MIERREFLGLSGSAVAGAALLNMSALQAQRPLPKSEYDYVDWSWESWRKITRSTKPNVSGPQAGKAELIDLLASAGQKITTRQAWTAQRDVTSSLLEVFLGSAPHTKPPLDARIIDETKHDTHLLRRLVFQTEPGEFVPSYLLVPKNLGPKTPVILCPHQTTQEGKREPAGLAGNPQLQTALHLVKRGFVTFTYDALCFGERHDTASGHYGDAIPFYRKHPRWSLLGKMVWDLSRAIDYLQTLDFVDSTRIGAMGHSHGGITTIFGMALDERIRAGASNCGFDTFRIDGNSWRWSHATALLPKLGFYVSSHYLNMERYRAVPDSEVIQTPFDLHEVLSLISPRPFFLSTSDEDFVFPNAGWSARQSLQRLEPVYTLLNASGNLGSYFFRGGHSLTSEAARLSYDWLERRLM